MNITRVASAAVVILFLAGCQTGGPKQTGGTLVGAGLGALAGSQIGRGRGQLAAVAIGALAGAMLGSNIGKSLDDADRQAALHAQGQAHTAPIGQSVSWNNPNSGNYGTFTPTRDGTDNRTGAYCREYQTTITVGGKTEQAYGTACRQPDGSWKVVN